MLKMNHYPAATQLDDGRGFLQNRLGIVTEEGNDLL
jgi:hypothetical protein